MLRPPLTTRVKNSVLGKIYPQNGKNNPSRDNLPCILGNLFPALFDLQVNFTIEKSNRCLMENKPKELKRLSAIIILISVGLLAILLALIFLGL